MFARAVEDLRGLEQQAIRRVEQCREELRRRQVTREVSRMVCRGSAVVDAPVDSCMPISQARSISFSTGLGCESTIAWIPLSVGKRDVLAS